MADTSPAAYRRRELGRIHVAKKSLGLDDDCYRDILERICNVKSAAELDSQGRFKLLKHFESLGWKPTARFSNKKNNDLKTKKIWSLWYQLNEAGKIQSASATGLRSFCKNRIGVDDVRFCNDAQKHQLIEMLKQWLGR